MAKENLFKVWTGTSLPKKILAIRLQALGDTFISLSYLNYLRKNLPSTTVIDFVTRVEFENIPTNLKLFNHVYLVKGGNPLRNQFFHSLKFLPKLYFAKYDVVLDLQNNELSRFIRKSIRPKCFVSFDRFSPIHARLRNINTINQAGFIKVEENYDFEFKRNQTESTFLKKHSLNDQKLILFNPAGAFENRNWPLINYLELAKLYENYFQNNVTFLLLGVSKIKNKGEEIEKALKERCINLIDKTSAIEALEIIQFIDLCITEDGALMHLSYLSKKPTLAILGSTRSDWLDPQLPHTFCFTSNDLACGNCMQATCKLGTNECITRVTPNEVFQKSIELLNTN